MNIVEYAERELNIRLNNIQRDLLSFLEQDPDAWQRIIKPAFHDTKIVLDIYNKWRESELIPC